MKKEFFELGCGCGLNAGLGFQICLVLLKLKYHNIIIYPMGQSRPRARYKTFWIFITTLCLLFINKAEVMFCVGDNWRLAMLWIPGWWIDLYWVLSAHTYLHQIYTPWCLEAGSALCSGRVECRVQSTTSHPSILMRPTSALNNLWPFKYWKKRFILHRYMFIGEIKIGSTEKKIKRNSKFSWRFSFVKSLQFCQFNCSWKLFILLTILTSCIVEVYQESKKIFWECLVKIL